MTTGLSNNDWRLRMAKKKTDVESKTFYICNRRKDCNNSERCGKECTHTSETEYALNYGKPMNFNRMGADFWEV